MLAKLASENTFEAIAREWIANQRNRLAPDTVRCSSPGLRRIYFRILVHARLPILMRRNCWTRLGRSKSAGSSRPPGGCGKFAAKYFDMPLRPGGQSTIRLPT